MTETWNATMALALGVWLWLRRNTLFLLVAAVLLGLCLTPN